MLDRFQPLLDGLLAARTEDDSGGDTFVIVMLVLVLLFFGWLVVAVIRKLLKPSGRIGELKEDEAEAARTARLWAEAKRRADEEEEEEAEEETEEVGQEGVDLQTELLDKARQRREERQAHDEVARMARQETLRGEAPVPKPVPKSLEEGLEKTRSGFVSRLTSMLGRKALDEDELEEIEEILFTADIGVRSAQKLTDLITNELGRAERGDPAKVLAAMKDEIHSMLAVEAPPVDVTAHKPFVILVIGVNGTGKTTTIGKLALMHVGEGRKVILAAADTFRAAAVEQLQIWGQRTDAQVIRGQEGGDPGAVVYDAISAAKSQGADVVIADTAGRLHTKVNLVEELAKVQRVCGKAMQGAPHEVWLILDATTGQNAINQARQFHKALGVTGIILTKLDGTAKGGVIIGIADTFGIPIRYIGIGEQASDLRPFDPQAFVKALFT